MHFGGSSIYGIFNPRESKRETKKTRYSNLSCKHSCPETNSNALDTGCTGTGSDIKTQVTKDCGKKKSCKVKPDKNRYKPDPCSGKSKYVTVDYECEECKIYSILFYPSAKRGLLLS